jgi:hypothetical protein
MARKLADWKRKLPMRFSSPRLLEVRIEGIRGDHSEKRFFKIILDKYYCISIV